MHNYLTTIYVRVGSSLALVVFLDDNLFTERNCASRQFHEKIELEIVKTFVGAGGGGWWAEGLTEMNAMIRSLF